MLSYKLPSKLDKEINELKGLIEKYKKGEITSIELKARRVPFGIYEQRELNTYMIRIRCAAGFITPSQLMEIAILSSKYGSGQIHLTTRQELQIHYVKMDNIIPVIKRLKEIGLASRGGGGNTVRNIIAQENAGVDPDEVFDVTPYAISLTSRLIAEDDSWTLPRKYKVAFSGSPEDKGHATITDIGFVAAKKDGEKGFKVYVAGGMGAKSKEANLLFDFVDEDEVYNVAEAGKILFWKYGNRKNKHAARLRFLWQSLGEEEFKKRFMKEYETIRKENRPLLEIKEIQNKGIDIDLAKEEADDDADFKQWKDRFVRKQKQKDLFTIAVPVHLGFLDNEKAIELAQFLRSFGDDVIRVTKEQNFLVRNIPEGYLTNVYNYLEKTQDNFNRPFVYDRLVSCAGASTCQLGICLSRGAAQALMLMFDTSNLDLDSLSDLKIRISGCPNSCGQHPISDLGFFGKAARKDEKLYPAYNVVVGAIVRDGETKLAEHVGEISAKDLPKLVKDFLELYLSEASHTNSFEEYIRLQGKEDLKKICAKYKEIPDFKEDKNYYYDWGGEKIFSLADRRSGECSAGLFDLIEVDLKNIQQTKEKISDSSDVNEKQKFLLDLVFYASRMLLITRAVEPKTEEETYRSFCEHFIETGLVDLRLRDVIEIAGKRDFDALSKKEKDVHALVERIKFLYENMDNAFGFQVPEASQSKPSDQKLSPKGDVAATTEDIKPNIVKDFRGIACPMNFVKTKMVLSTLKPNDILEVWLDDGEPIVNVPGSVKEEGHKILSQEKIDDYWSVFIEKK